MTDRYTTTYGVYHITPKPEMPQVAICHSFYVMADVRGIGHGHKLMDSMMWNLEMEHFDYAMLTTAADNLAMQAILVRAGWTLSSTFFNRKTGLPHQVWHYTLNHVSHN